MLPEVPGSVDKITATWVEQALRQALVIPEYVKVSSLEIQQLTNVADNIDKDGGGASGSALVRFLLTYEGEGSEEMPSSMICKFTTGTRRDYSFKARTLYNLYFGDDANWAVRENNFFQKIAPRLSETRFQYPRAYFSNIAIGGKRSVAKRYLTNTPHNVRSVVLMEDLKGWKGILVGKAVSKEQTILCMKNIATFHAAFWGKAEEMQSEGIQFSTFEKAWRPGRYSKIMSYLQKRKIATPAKIRKTVDRFLKGVWPDHPVTKPYKSVCFPDWMTVAPNEEGKLAQLQDPLVHEMLYVLAERLPNYYQYAIKALDRVAPQTLIHGDFHGGNHMFGTFLEEGQVMAVDFQFTGLGIAVMDIVYFLDSSCPLRNYQDVEDILKAYHDTLVENGVCGYSWDTLVREFEAFVVSRLLTGPLFMGYEPEPFIELITTLIGAEKSDISDRLIDSGVFCRPFLTMTSMYVAKREKFLSV